MINKKIKKCLVVSACVAMCFAIVGCSSNKKDSKTGNKQINENVMDVRTAKIINQQQAILKFTTANKAGSVVSIELVPSGDSYVYTLIAVDKKGIEHIYTINGKDGNITKTEDKGPIDKTNPPEYIDFVPVLDIQKAGNAAVGLASNKDENQILAYKLYAKGGKNIYEFTLTDGNEQSPKNEKIYIDGITGKKLEESELKSSSESNSNKQSQNTTSENTSSDVN